MVCRSVRGVRSRDEPGQPALGPGEQRQLGVLAESAAAHGPRGSPAFVHDAAPRAAWHHHIHAAVTRAPVAARVTRRPRADAAEQHHQDRADHGEDPLLPPGKRLSTPVWLTALHGDLA